MIVNNITGESYVGQSKNIKRRWYDHRTKAIHPKKKDEYTSLLYQSIRKYGIENFYIKILEECSINDLDKREVYWIKKLDTFNNGYNNDFGGTLPCYTKEHRETDHGNAKLSVGDVKMCREAYKNGMRSRDVYEKYFNSKISWRGFLKMWHGKTWKSIMPEVFRKNPHPRRKATDEQISDIRNRYENGESCRSIARAYKNVLGYCTIYNIAHYKTHQDIYNSDVSTISIESTQPIGTAGETGFLTERPSKK